MLHRTVRGHPEALLVEAAVRVTQGVGGGLVGPGQPRTEHHVGSAACERERDVAREPDAAVGPDVTAEPPRLRGALHHGRELGPSDTRHHPSGAHRARADADLDDVGASLDQLAGAVGGDHVAGDDLGVGELGADGLDRPQRAGLVAVRGVDHEHVDTVADEFLGPSRRVAVDPHRDGHHQATVRIDGRR